MSNSMTYEQRLDRERKMKKAQKKIDKERGQQFAKRRTDAEFARDLKSIGLSVEDLQNELA